LRDGFDRDKQHSKELKDKEAEWDTKLNLESKKVEEV
jgi:hypothetical protein